MQTKKKGYDNAESLGERIRELRKNKGLSQYELAREIKVSQATVASWENNTRKPTIELIQQTANYFNVSSDYLLGNESQDKEIDISKKINEALLQLELEADSLMFDGTPMDDTTKQLLTLSLKNTLALAKLESERNKQDNKDSFSKKDE